MYVYSCVVNLVSEKTS